MAKVTRMQSAMLVMMLLVLTPLAVALPVNKQQGEAAVLPKDDDLAAATVQAVRSSNNQENNNSKDVDNDGEEMAADQPQADEEEMQERMLDLLFRLWDAGDLALDPPQSLQPQERLRRGRRSTVVFRPLWATRDRDAKKLWMRQQRFGQYRYGRVGRAASVPARVSSTSFDGYHYSLPRERRDVLAAPEEAVTESKEASTATPRLSRARRQFAFRPLFVARQSQAGEELFRVRRDAKPTSEPMASDDNKQASAKRSSRPLLSRVRREWADVPLFAVRQIESERLKEHDHLEHRSRRKQYPLRTPEYSRYFVEEPEW